MLRGRGTESRGCFGARACHRASSVGVKFLTYPGRLLIPVPLRRCRRRSLRDGLLPESNARVVEVWNAEDVGPILLLELGGEPTRPVELLQGRHRDARPAREELGGGRARPVAGVDGEPNGHDVVREGGSVTGQPESHDVHRRRGAVEPEAPRAVEGHAERHPEGGEDAVEPALLRGELRELAQVLAVHVHLLDRELAACREPLVAELGVVHVVLPVIAEYAQTSSASRASRAKRRSAAHWNGGHPAGPAAVAARPQRRRAAAERGRWPWGVISRPRAKGAATRTSRKPRHPRP
mmetsp:Transcript_53489/g.152605  ORF Transcript_53489/g.152605 Transcript_53489/m.152605 type:complete len:294 (-) Transcript_53489:8-889(-)